LELNIREGLASGTGGIELFWRLWAPENPWASLFLIHGLGEHSGRYDNIARRIGEEGVSVFSFDLRGHGRSAGTRGDVLLFSHFLEDLVEMEEVQRREVSGNGKRFLLGHSLGGLIALRHLQALPKAYDGGIFSAPWLRSAQPAWIRAFGRGLGRILPSQPLPSGLGSGRLTRDPEMAAIWRDDPLIHTRVTGRLFREAERAQGEVLADGSLLEGLPLLFLVPQKDPVVDSSVTVTFAGGVTEMDVRVEILEGRLHEAFNDLGREEVFDIVAAWLGQQKS
jgi:alpha-beta hydrolase superfamily lysophospholipase